nr:hypothetical protein Q903MT_gene3543 [Picea sitchensis]
MRSVSITLFPLPLRISPRNIYLLNARPTSVVHKFTPTLVYVCNQPRRTRSQSTSSQEHSHYRCS